MPGRTSYIQGVSEGQVNPYGGDSGPYLEQKILIHFFSNSSPFPSYATITRLSSLDSMAILSLRSVVKYSCLVNCSVFPISSCFRLILTSSKGEVVSKMFTNDQYWDMHFVCGFSNGNAAAAESEYRTPHFRKDSIQRDGYLKPYTDGWGIQVCHNLPIVLVVQEIM